MIATARCPEWRRALGTHHRGSDQDIYPMIDALLAGDAVVRAWKGAVCAQSAVALALQLR